MILKQLPPNDRQIYFHMFDVTLESGEYKSHITKWLKENIGRYKFMERDRKWIVNNYRGKHNRFFYGFRYSEDAMAFKLMWI